ncbi:hypothetical protein OIU80_04090 [Flavobacterium sp. LS1R47]|uniref:Uncharacterized protein n=1 Tax=Flavobacterium frigoritolerans TaxID=2987686 RepID=A0A9X3C0U6_9FLAO|nr:hypothetical protein [Flavobacterium frigoritolerans]MCV9931451.1 hypothetical protein [Flavobacterium frigoritolerans]
MGTLKEDIRKQSDWIIKAFEVDGYKLDFSIASLMEIDLFFEKNLVDGRPKRRGRLSKNYGGIIFSISSYVAETLIKNVSGSKLITDDKDPHGEINFSIEFPNGMVCWPGQRIIKRIQNGLEDGVYPYGYELTKEYIPEKFDDSFWNIGKKTNNVESVKPWWKFW